MRRLWAGELSHDGALEGIGPTPVQDRVPVLVGALGDRSIRLAADWSDGVIGFSFGLDADELATAFGTTQQAWRDADRADPPQLVTGTWFALGGDPAGQMRTYLDRYLAFLGPDASALAGLADIRGEAALRDALERARAAGAHEVLLTPTTADPAELDRAAKVAFG